METSLKKVLIVQTDNRKDVDYLGLTKLTNSRIVDYLKTAEHLNGIEYRYEYIHMEPRYYKDIHPAAGKIYVVDELLNTISDDVIVFLDSDAWIQNPDYLHDLLVRLISSDKNGCYSRDPYVKKNTYVNSGSFLLKVNDFTRMIYKEIIEFLKADTSHHNLWTYDQYYVAQIIYNHKEEFTVFIPEVINTPYGEILRHNWWKSQKMFVDLYKILDVNNPYKRPTEPYDFEKQIDPHCWPNPNEIGYEYWA
jgi:hypothetical protein